MADVDKLVKCQSWRCRHGKLEKNLPHREDRDVLVEEIGADLGIFCKIAKWELEKLQFSRMIYLAKAYIWCLVLYNLASMSL